MPGTYPVGNSTVYVYNCKDKVWVQKEGTLNYTSSNAPYFNLTMYHRGYLEFNGVPSNDTFVHGVMYRWAYVYGVDEDTMLSAVPEAHWDSKMGAWLVAFAVLLWDKGIQNYDTVAPYTNPAFPSQFVEPFPACNYNPLGILPSIKVPHTEITIAQAYDMIYSTSYPNLVVMDIRAATEAQNFDTGHILGAINVPVIPPSPYNFDALMTWINSAEGQSHKNDEIIVHCRTGGRSHQACLKLEDNGFTKVYDLSVNTPAFSATNAVIDVWKNAGHPIINVTATIDIKPETLNLKSHDKWVTCYIELPTLTPNSVNDIVVSTIKMNGAIQAKPQTTKIGDHDHDGIPDLMVKFDQAMVESLLSTGEKRLWITFELSNGKLCGGWDTVKVTRCWNTYHHWQIHWC
jgi:rhodanese-related sulfurtransferase